MSYINIVKSVIYDVYDELIWVTNNYYAETSFACSRSLEKVELNACCLVFIPN